MKLSIITSIVLLSITNFAAAGMEGKIEAFDNFVLSYGDFERCTFGLHEISKRSVKPTKDKQVKVTHIKKEKATVNCAEKTSEPHMKENILHAVEYAEQAFVHAVRDEVDLLFNDRDHRETRTVSMVSPDASTRNRRSRKSVFDTKNNDRNRFGWGLDQFSGFA